MSGPLSTERQGATSPAADGHLLYMYGHARPEGTHHQTRVCTWSTVRASGETRQRTHVADCVETDTTSIEALGQVNDMVLAEGSDRDRDLWEGCARVSLQHTVIRPGSGFVNGTVWWCG